MSRVRPLIGITAYVEQARWGVWDTTAALVPYAYVRQVEEAGGRAVLLPPDQADNDDLIDVLDALVLAGGPDIDPAHYGAAAHPETANPRPQRDAGELALLRAGYDRDLPVLGICRGMQVMAVAAGGTLHQHLPELVGHDQHRPSPGVYGEHAVLLEPGSRVQSILGDKIVVRSYHHQGVAQAGSLAVTGWADDDTIEVVESPGHRFALGVLWHPEAGDDPRLFDALIAATRA